MATAASIGRTAALVAGLVVVGIVLFNVVTFAGAFAHGPRPRRLAVAFAKELVAWRYIERLGGARRVRHLVTIATPHRGTRWSRVAFGGARGHMRRGAACVARLGAGMPSVRYTSVWSRCDNLVVPPESASLAA